MKKKLITAVLALSFIFTGYSAAGINAIISTKLTVNASTPKTKVFTLNELKKYNGKNGKPAYVAIGKVVYDVTHAKGWRNGKHQGYSAGKDLTKFIKLSPHGKSVLKKLRIVGRLK